MQGKKVTQTQDQAQACGACGEKLAAGAAFCDRCGAPQPGAPRCPHHRGAGQASPHPELRYVCDVCGGPVVRLNQIGLKLSGNEVKHLEQARVLRRQRNAWRLGAVVAAAGAVASLGALGLLWLLLGVGLWSGAVGFALATPLLLLALVAYAKARARAKEIGEAVDEAWKRAVRDVALGSGGGGITAQELTQALPLGEDDADRLLAQLEVDNELCSEVTPEGKLSFAAPLMRIDAAYDSGRALSAAGNLEAELEQLADEEAAAAHGKARPEPG